MADVELKLIAETKEALQSIESFSSGAVGALKTFAAAAVTYLAGSAVIGALENFIEAGQESEDAINALNISLASSGTYSAEASKAFQEFATEMQNTVGISDEVILQQAAIARNFTKTNEEAIKLTQAAVQLSAATGKDLNSSIEALGKSVQGVGAGLSKSLPAIKGFTEEQLKAGAAVDFVLQRFGGVAEAKLQSFSGAVNSAKIAFSDIGEEIGTVIIKNPILIKVISLARDGFAALTKIVSNNKDVINEFISKGIKFLISLVPKVIQLIDVLVKAFAGVVLVLGKTIAITVKFLELLLEFKLIQNVVNILKDGFASIGSAIAFTLKGLISLIENLPGVSSLMKTMGVDIEKLKGSIDDFGTALINNVGKDITGEIRNNLDKFSIAANDATESAVSGLGNVSESLNSVKDYTQNVSDEMQLMGNESVDANLKAVESLNKNAKAVRNVGQELEALKKKVEDAFKKPFDFVVKMVIEETSKIDSKVKTALESARKWIADNPLVVETVAATAGLLNAIYKSGAQGSQALELELTSAIESANAQLTAAIKDIMKTKEDALVEIETDFASSMSAIQKDLENGAITQVEYQQKESDLQKKRILDTKKAQSKAEDDIQKERIKNEQEIIKIREDHAKKLKDLQEKNVQAAAEVAGQMANAAASALGLPPIFGDIIKMMSAPPEVWQGIIDGLAQGIPTLIERIIENIPTIILALADAMPEVAGKLTDAILTKLTDPNFWAKIVEANIKASIAPTQALGNTLKVIFEDIGKIFQKIVDAIKNTGSNILDAGKNFVTKIIEGAGQFIKKLIDEITGALNKATGGLFSKPGSVVQNTATTIGSSSSSGALATVAGVAAAPIQAIANVVKGIKIKFAKGGMVPDGYPNDTYPALLTSGEMVIPRTDVQRLSSFLDGQDTGSNNQDLISQLKAILGSVGSEKNITVNLQVGEKELASVILDLNRKGFRTA